MAGDDSFSALLAPQGDVHAACVAIPRGAAAARQLDPKRAVPDEGGGVAQKVEPVDIDADGFVDLVFAHSRDELGGEADALVDADGGLVVGVAPPGRVTS
jgi:hypothetical protein